MTASVRTVDALGTYCPVPIHLISEAIELIAPGEVLTLLADDPLVEIDLPAWCHESGNQIVELTVDATEYRALVRKRSKDGTHGS